jgi:hypothetical protein
MQLAWMIRALAGSMLPPQMTRCFGAGQLVDWYFHTLLVMLPNVDCEPMVMNPATPSSKPYVILDPESRLKFGVDGVRVVKKELLGPGANVGWVYGATPMTVPSLSASGLLSERLPVQLCAVHLWNVEHVRMHTWKVDCTNLYCAGLKAKILQRDPRASMLVDDQTPPYSFVKIDGTVTLSGDVAEVRKWAEVLGGRYMGADRAAEYGERNGVPGEFLVRLWAEHVVAMRDISA